MSGTALPASAVITSSDQVAAVVIDGHHVRQNDGTAVREQLATYRVTFNSEALDGSSPRGPRDLSNCAVTATPTMTGMENVPYQPQEVLGPTTLIVTRKTLPGLNSIPPLGPNSVRVQSLKPSSPSVAGLTIHNCRNPRAPAGLYGCVNPPRGRRWSDER